MRIIPGFLIREIAGEIVAIPSGDAARCLSGLVVINDCGKYLFDLLQSEQSLEDLVCALTECYEVDRLTAGKDVEEFLQILRDNNMLIESPEAG